MLGQTLSHYRVVRTLGSGGMGVVYEAEDLHLARRVALKVLPPELAVDGIRRQRFEREAKALAALNHPNIVTIYSIEQVEGQAFITMELVEGRRLSYAIPARGMPYQQVLALATQLASGLSAAHQCGIIHRDIKPSNVIVTPQAHVKILDFGVAKLRETDVSEKSTTAAVGDALTGDNRILGTVEYMSPEQAQGAALDHRTDIFSMGIVLYEMATGARPFVGSDKLSVASSILRDVPPLVSDVNPAIPIELARVVRRCLQKDPEKRYQSAKDLRNELAELSVESASGELQRETRNHQRAGVTRWRDWLLGSALGAVLVGAALLAWLGWSGLFSAHRGDASPMENAEFALGIPAHVTVAAGWETEPALSPDGSLVAYTSNQEGDSGIWLTSCQGGASLRLVSDSGMDEKPTWFPDGSSIAFQSNRGGRYGIWKVPVLGGSPTVVVEDAQDPAISPDARSIAFVRTGVNGDMRIHVASLADPSKAREVTRGVSHQLMGETSPAWSPDGKWLCYAGDRSLWVVASDGGIPRQLTKDREFDIEPAWSGDGSTIYFSSNRGGVFALWQVGVAGGPAHRLTRGAGPERHPTVSRDGRRIAFSTFSDQTDLVVRDLRRGTEDGVVTTRSEKQPDFAHDGQAVIYVFDAGAGGGSELRMQRIAGARLFGEPRRLMDAPGEVTHPRFSPDDRFVAYQRNHGGSRQVWIAPVAGGPPVQFTSSAGDNFHPGWSPAGRHLAFVSSREGDPQVWIAPVADGHPAGPARRVTAITGIPQEPVFSPNGSRIAFLAEDSRGCDVWVTNADGTGPPRRVTTDARADFLRWAPRSTELIVSGRWKEGVVSLRRVDPATGASTAPIDWPRTCRMKR